MTSLPDRNSPTSRRAFIAGAAAIGAATALSASTALAATGPDDTATRPDTTTTPAAVTPSSNVHIFYYPWYGSPKVNGSYRHWPQTESGLTPPNGIASNFYPQLGPYDSGDSTAVAQHMTWLQQAGVGTLITSWWGQGSYEDQRVPLILDQAENKGLKVGFHIEPYGNRTASSVVSDINYIISKYGGHPAFYRDTQHGNRGAFYVFQSLHITDWSALDSVSSQAIVLAQTGDVSKVTHFGGMYTYDGIAASQLPDWSGIDQYCKAHDLVWSPSFSPGYLDDRAVPGNTSPTVDRANGTAYDKVWQHVISSGDGGSAPTWVSITSFNEWHEGTQIEPATNTPPTTPVTYLTYNGAYGKTGTSAQSAYLDRTAYWVPQYVAHRG